MCESHKGACYNQKYKGLQPSKMCPERSLSKAKLEKHNSLVLLSKKHILYKIFRQRDCAIQIPLDKCLPQGVT